MTLSVCDIFKIGVGPSSSHTIGPMRAAKRFVDTLKSLNFLNADGMDMLQVRLYGSLASTGVGHGTDVAVIAGLEGYLPENIPTKIMQQFAKDKLTLDSVHLNRELRVKFQYGNNIKFCEESLCYHPNGMEFIAFFQDKVVHREKYYSVGGGFVVTENAAKDDRLVEEFFIDLPYKFSSGKELLLLCKKNRCSICDIAYENELSFRPKDLIDKKLLEIWSVMEGSIHSGLRADGYLPGRLKVKRRAKAIYKSLKDRPEQSLRDPLSIMDWVDLYALAVNEENASGGRVVTAPTNGAAGIIPAVLMYYLKFCHNNGVEDIKKFLLTSGTIGILYKLNASISGAEVGCQGEVGVASSMAAAGLTEVLGGTFLQVENAAEIAMEHHLGLTCDPIDGQVQIPCIERNAMSAVKAINASRMALKGKGTHYVSLDQVMKTMKETGLDMKDKYKETSKGGLAVNITEC